MADWNSELYRQFEAERTRPARDLLAFVPLAAPRRVVDLGCGPGNSTALLAERYPNAEITGLDTWENMLASARERLSGCEFVQGDIADWSPRTPPDLIFANASLQWVPDHERLLPRLFGALAQGGVLAVQMPDNFDEPTHRLMRETAAAGPWRARIGDGAARRVERLPMTAYYDLLAPSAAQVEIWRTTYVHPMPSPDAIVTWLRGTGLKPFVEPLDPDQQKAFLAAYTEAIAQHYRPHADGRLLLAFPRLFLVAHRR